MDDTKALPITHKVWVEDTKGEIPAQWFASVDDGETFHGVNREPEAGDRLEFGGPWLTIPIRYPNGFTALGMQHKKVIAV